jgi:hypothetical protein
MSLQLDFFLTEEECELHALKKSIEEVRKSGDKVRKGTYARLNELNKECVELKSRMDILERYICRG